MPDNVMKLMNPRAALGTFRAILEHGGLGHDDNPAQEIKRCGNREGKAPCSAGTYGGGRTVSSVPRSKGTSLVTHAGGTEENPLGRSFRTAKKEEEFSENGSKKTQPKIHSRSSVLYPFRFAADREIQMLPENCVTADRDPIAIGAATRRRKVSGITRPR